MNDRAVRVLVLRTAGVNCDEETAHAFELAGAEVVERLHVSALFRRERGLEEFDILVFPGGFSYGDDLGAGTVLANQLRARLEDDLGAFVASGRLVLGICNGFQVLVRLGILPGWEGEKAAALIENASGRFEDRWVELSAASRLSPFVAGAARVDFAGDHREAPALRFPVAHREGRFVLRSPELLERLREGGQIAFVYAGPGTDAPAGGAYPANPNGSVADIAGITNPRGNVLGLMPHPERAVEAAQGPLWTRRFPRQAASAATLAAGDGLRIFENAVAFARARG